MAKPTIEEAREALVAGWARVDPSWAHRGGRRAERPSPALDDDRVIGMVRERVIERAGPEIDFGPDLGL